MKVIPNMSHQKVYTFWCCDEVTQKLVLPGISNLNNSDLDKKQGDLTQFSAKATLEKRK